MAIARSQSVHDGADRHRSKAYSEYFDPCQEAANKSIRCLNRNGGDREMCSDFFQAYRDCKEQWVGFVPFLGRGGWDVDADAMLMCGQTQARKEARKKSSWFG